jgi:general secretion pathway protein G
MNAPTCYRHAKRTSRRGFTLMEMLIVLSIIALLMSMVIFQVSSMSAGAEKTKVRADLFAFKEMLAAYQLDNGMLPTTEQGLKALWSRPTADPVPQHWHAQLDSETLDPWGHHYQYLNPGTHNPDKYDVFSLGPENRADSPNVIGNWSDTPSSTTP